MEITQIIDIIETRRLSGRADRKSVKRFLLVRLIRPNVDCDVCVCVFFVDVDIVIGIEALGNASEIGC